MFDLDIYQTLINMNRKRLILGYPDKILEHHLKGLTEYVFKTQTI